MLDADIEAAAADAVRQAEAERRADTAAAALAWDAAAVERTLPESIVSDGRRGCLLPVGEVSVFAGLSGIGKSTVTLHAAVAAAAADDGLHVELWPHGPTIRGGPVVAVGYEDAAPWLHLRAKDAAAFRDGATGDSRHAKAIADTGRLSVAVLDGPLTAYQSEQGGGGSLVTTPAWAAVWSRVREIGARFVVIDPVALALDSGPMGYAPGPVSEFYRGLRQEAAQTGSAVLLVAHMPKAARGKGPNDIDAGDISGSAAWVDRSRSALTLASEQNIEDRYALTVQKANYAATGTAWPLTVRRAESGRPVAFVPFEGTALHGEDDEDKPRH